MGNLSSLKTLIEVHQKTVWVSEMWPCGLMHMLGHVAQARRLSLNPACDVSP